MSESIITTILIEDKQAYKMRNDNGQIMHIKTKDKYEGWKRIRNEVKSRYICFNFEDKFLKASEEQLNELNSGSIKMILMGYGTRYKWQVQYRDLYYYHDFKVMMEVLKKYYPPYYKYMNEIIEASFYFQFAGFFNKKEFDKIWDWIEEVLNRCEKNIPNRCSTFQNKWREHLTPFLFSIYVEYWKFKEKYFVSFPFELEKGKADDDGRILTAPKFEAPREEILKFLSGLISEGDVEKALEFVFKELRNRNDMKDVYKLFLEYERERQCDALTTLDKERSLENLLAKRGCKETVAIKKTSKPQMFILNWMAIGREVVIKAFEKFGFECTCMEMPHLMEDMDEAFYDKMDKCLESNKFDVVFSVNYNERLAQACFQHDIPYLAWIYDSPSFVKKNKNLEYPTTNCFIFDSDDWRHYKDAGVKNAYHFPLAADIDYYDNIICSDKEKDMYNSEISFVGRLYDTVLTEAMRYLPDYDKAFLVSIMDNQSKVRGYDLCTEILSEFNLDWLGNPKFNWIINHNELDSKDNPQKTTNALDCGMLPRLINQQVTNKDRLLILTLLAKHHEVKLYSDKNSELFGNLEFCGRVDYYTQMPKIFKCSKINLNITLRDILNGIPLRCIDIMACGGCLLTNYQKDFDEHFRDGENLIFYEEPGEALEKADFYLTHDTQREKIALAGYETVKKYYTYPVKIREMLELAGLEDLIKACGR